MKFILYTKAITTENIVDMCYIKQEELINYIYKITNYEGYTLDYDNPQGHRRYKKITNTSNASESVYHYVHVFDTLHLYTSTVQKLTRVNKVSDTYV